MKSQKELPLLNANQEKRLKLLLASSIVFKVHFEALRHDGEFLGNLDKYQDDSIYTPAIDWAYQALKPGSTDEEKLTLIQTIIRIMTNKESRCLIEKESSLAFTTVKHSFWNDGGPPETVQILVTDFEAATLCEFFTLSSTDGLKFQLICKIINEVASSSGHHFTDVNEKIFKLFMQSTTDQLQYIHSNCKPIKYQYNDTNFEKKFQLRIDQMFQLKPLSDWYEGELKRAEKSENPAAVIKEIIEHPSFAVYEALPYKHPNATDLSDFLIKNKFIDSAKLLLSMCPEKSSSVLTAALKYKNRESIDMVCVKPHNAKTTNTLSLALENAYLNSDLDYLTFLLQIGAKALPTLVNAIVARNDTDRLKQFLEFAQGDFYFQFLIETILQNKFDLMVQYLIKDKVKNLTSYEREFVLCCAIDGDNLEAIPLLKAHNIIVGTEKYTTGCYKPKLYKGQPIERSALELPFIQESLREAMEEFLKDQTVNLRESMLKKVDGKMAAKVDKNLKQLTQSMPVLEPHFNALRHDSDFLRNLMRYQGDYTQKNPIDEACKALKPGSTDEDKRAVIKSAFQWMVNSKESASQWVVSSKEPASVNLTQSLGSDFQASTLCAFFEMNATDKVKFQHLCSVINKVEGPIGNMVNDEILLLLMKCKADELEYLSHHLGPLQQNRSSNSINDWYESLKNMIKELLQGRELSDWYNGMLKKAKDSNDPRVIEAMLEHRNFANYQNSLSLIKKNPEQPIHHSRPDYLKYLVSFNREEDATDVFVFLITNQFNDLVVTLLAKDPQKSTSALTLALKYKNIELIERLCKQKLEEKAQTILNQALRHAYLEKETLFFATLLNNGAVCDDEFLKNIVKDIKEDEQTRAESKPMVQLLLQSDPRDFCSLFLSQLISYNKPEFIREYLPGPMLKRLAEGSSALADALKEDSLEVIPFLMAHNFCVDQKARSATNEYQFIRTLGSMHRSSKSYEDELPLIRECLWEALEELSASKDANANLRQMILDKLDPKMAAKAEQEQRIIVGFTLLTGYERIKCWKPSNSGLIWINGQSQEVLHKLVGKKVRFRFDTWGSTIGEGVLQTVGNSHITLGWKFNRIPLKELFYLIELPSPSVEATESSGPSTSLEECTQWSDQQDVNLLPSAIENLLGKIVRIETKRSSIYEGTMSFSPHFCMPGHPISMKESLQIDKVSSTIRLEDIRSIRLFDATLHLGQGDVPLFDDNLIKLFDRLIQRLPSLGRHFKVLRDDMEFRRALLLIEGKVISHYRTLDPIPWVYDSLKPDSTDADMQAVIKSIVRCMKNIDLNELEELFMGRSYGGRDSPNLDNSFRASTLCSLLELADTKKLRILCRVLSQIADPHHGRLVNDELVNFFMGYEAHELQSLDSSGFAKIRRGDVAKELWVELMKELLAQKRRSDWVNKELKEAQQNNQPSIIEEMLRNPDYSQYINSTYPKTAPDVMKFAIKCEFYDLVMTLLGDDHEKSFSVLIDELKGNNIKLIEKLCQHEKSKDVEVVLNQVLEKSSDDLVPDIVIRLSGGGERNNDKAMLRLLLQYSKPNSYRTLLHWAVHCSNLDLIREYLPDPKLKELAKGSCEVTNDFLDDLVKRIVYRLSDGEERNNDKAVLHLLLQYFEPISYRTLLDWAVCCNNLDLIREYLPDPKLKELAQGSCAVANALRDDSLEVIPLLIANNFCVDEKARDQMDEYRPKISSRYAHLKDVMDELPLIRESLQEAMSDLLNTKNPNADLRQMMLDKFKQKTTVSRPLLTGYQQRGTGGAASSSSSAFGPKTQTKRSPM